MATGTFTGAPDSGNQVANAVTDPAVRSALGAYLKVLGQAIPAGLLYAVREGGGPDGELRYPDASYDGHTNCWWAYDPSTQSTSPVPGWKPGSGTEAQAVRFLESYNANLTTYGAWLDDQLSADFFTTVAVLLPGWGQCPGVAAGVTRSLLSSSYDEFNQALDWSAELAALPHPSTAIAYTTYLDAPSYDSTVDGEDPADYLASLPKPRGMTLGGENTGNGTIAALSLCVRRAKSLHFVVFNWMSESQLVASTSGAEVAGPSYHAFRAALSTG